MARLTVHLLGPFTIFLDEVEVRGIESDKTRALLAYLVVEANHPHRREKLAALLWSDQTEGRALASLSQALYNLRTVLGDRGASVPFLIVEPQTLQFNPLCDSWVDVRAIDELLDSCRHHSHHRLDTCATCAAALIQAAAISQGGFLEGFHTVGAVGFEEWALVTRERLQQQMLTALAELAAYHEGRSEILQALAATQRAVQMDPLWEAGQRNLMRLLSLDGRQEAALSQYRKFRRLLGEELGLEPDNETRALCKRLQREVQGSADMDRLQVPLTSFVGRKRELAELSALLRSQETRLVTLLGAGGSGKTRLALQVAHLLRYHFPDGVFLAVLGEAGPAKGLVQALAEALDIKFGERADHRAQLQGYLHNKRLLLILDSFETVLGEAVWLSDLLHLSPHVKALVTSRARLNLKAEQLYRLGGLHCPPPQEALDASGRTLEKYSAVALFQEGAARAGGGKAWSPEAWLDVGRVCRLVQGLPLSVLLASAWLGTFTPGEIANEIERGLDFLSTQWQDQPERQASLRATLDYSYRLLTPAEQELFCKLSVFRGGFTRQSAAAVAGAGPHLLQRLVDKTMLDSPIDSHYNMHDLVRAYAEEKLDEREALSREVRERHSAFFLERMVSWERDLKSPLQRQALEQIDHEVREVQVGWLWSVRQMQTGRLECALEGMGTYYELRSRYAEGIAACQAAADGLAGQDAPGARILQGWLQAWQARFLRLSGEVEQAQELRQASRASLAEAKRRGEDTRRGEAMLDYELGYTASSIQDQINWLQRSASCYQSLGDDWRQADVLAWAGELSCRLGERSQGMEFFQGAVALGRAVGEPRRLASALQMLAIQTVIGGQWETAARLMEEAVDCYQAAGDQGQEATAYLHLGVMLGWTGRFVEAKEYLGRTLPVLREIGHRFYVAYGTLALGVCQLHLGEYDQAERTLQIALEAARKDSFNREIAASLATLGLTALIRGQPAQALVFLQESMERYRTLSAAMELGLALGGLALADLANSRQTEALTALHEMLGIARETHNHFTSMTSWAASVALLADAGHWERALMVYTAGLGVPFLSGSRWQAEIVAPWVALASQRLPPEDAQAARLRGEGRDLFAVQAELLEDFSQLFELPGPPLDRNQDG